MTVFFCHPGGVQTVWQQCLFKKISLAVSHFRRGGILSGHSESMVFCTCIVAPTTPISEEIFGGVVVGTNLSAQCEFQICSKSWLRVMGLALSENARRRLLSHKCDLGNSARPDYFKWTFQQLLQKSSRTGKSLEFGRKTVLPRRSRVFENIESEFRKTLTGPDPWYKCQLSFLIVPENHLALLERLQLTKKNVLRFRRRAYSRARRTRFRGNQPGACHAQAPCCLAAAVHHG